MIVLDIFLTVLLFSLFAVSHTFFASLKFKKKLAEKIGVKIAFYRLFYNITSLIFFFVFYKLSPKPDVIVYDLHYPFDIITFALQVLSIIGLIWAAKPVNWKTFAGITQIEKYLHGEYKSEELDEKLAFKIERGFKFVRHPIYFFSILILVFRPTMSLFYFVMFVCITIYFYVGSIYEEKKLVEIFGKEYKEYQLRVPRMFPIKILNPKFKERSS